MLTLRQVLHLHPLTLEDIVQQETREKLEAFPRLGYYFVVFRAVEARMNLERGVEMILGVTVYLVVFRDGICSVSVLMLGVVGVALTMRVQFHFEDISEHTDRVRNRILQLEKSRAWTPGERRPLIVISISAHDVTSCRLDCSWTYGFHCGRILSHN